MLTSMACSNVVDDTTNRLKSMNVDIIETQHPRCDFNSGNFYVVQQTNTFTDQHTLSNNTNQQLVQQTRTNTQPDHRSNQLLMDAVDNGRGNNSNATKGTIDQRRVEAEMGFKNPDAVNHAKPSEQPSRREPSDISKELDSSMSNDESMKSNNEGLPKQRQLIGAVDQGTSSTRFLVFENGTGRLIASTQIEIRRIVPKEGWVEIDPDSIMDSVYDSISRVHQQLNSDYSDDSTDSSKSSLEHRQISLKCIGICNQRESAVVWDSKTGRALYNVIVWMDNRTKDLVDAMIDSLPGRDSNWLKDKTGLPMSTYFSAFKLMWLIENVPDVKAALKEKRLMFGTVDSWILWNLTGNHYTDVTNASRTYLMDIETLNWDKSLCKHFGIPMGILPKILASADDFGKVKHGPFRGTPITGVIGDQSAALFGHNCLQVGQTKATFGTGCFIMQNIGTGPIGGALSGIQREAKQGLITTVGYKLRDKPACYALEGSIKIAGAALTWLRDNMQLIQNYEECDQLINKTTNSAGVFFVPALGGLYSPYWDPNAAGLFIGLSQFTRREHLVRATFDSIAFQTNDILSLMRGVTNGLMIDGGLCKSDNMCQILADITGCDIVRPSMCETSALGAAMVAGCGAGIWSYESMLENSSMPYDSSCNQTHHYPQECLHYEEKFSSLIQSKSFLPAQAAARRVANQSRCKSQPQHQLVRPSSGCSGSRSVGRESSMSPLLISITCKLHSGGCEDDAGGGQSSCIDYEDDEDEDEASSSSHYVSSDDTDQEPGVLSSDDYNTKPNGAEGVDSMDILAIEATRDNFIGCSMVDDDQKVRYHMAPSSGYSSGDNFELAVPESCTDPRRCRDSPSCPSRTSARLDQVRHSKQSRLAQTNLVDIFQMYISLEHRSELVETWRRAVGRSMQWTKVHHEEVRRNDYQRLATLPISMYFFLSLGTVVLSGLLSGGRLMN